MKRVPNGVTGKEFHDFFTKYGNIISAKLAEDEDGDAKGYGFVLYDSTQAAENAVAQANDFVWKEKKLYVGKFIKNKPKLEHSFNNIYVKSIPKASF